MKRIRRIVFTAALSLMFAGAASAVPIELTLQSVDSTGGIMPSVTTYDPVLPIVDATSSIDFATGTGILNLPDYSTTITLDGGTGTARIDIANWRQTITSINIAGHIQSIGSGSSTCTDLGGLGSAVCALVATTVAGWPPPNSGSNISSAVINPGAGTITVVDKSMFDMGGTITMNFTYEPIATIPEPSTALLLGGGLAGLGMAGRRRRA